MVLGWSCVCIGAVGVVLPLLPTTPFMLIALWAFSQSSRRFHDWLYHHRLFGPPLKEWHQGRVIRPRAKIAALGLMAASLLYVLFVAQPPLWASITMAAILAGAATYVGTRPSRLAASREEVSPIQSSR